MNNLYRLLLVAAILLICGNVGAQTHAVSVDAISNQLNSDTLFAGGPVEFSLRVTNTPGDGCAYNPTFGFIIYSPDGATWDTAVIDTTGNLGLTQFGQVYLSSDRVTGSVTDSVGAAFIYLGGERTDTALYDGFDDIALTVTIYPDVSSEGKTICIDTISYPGYAWLWSGLAPCSNAYPSWDGPHCFTLISCCGYYSGGLTGNTNFDPAGTINITDIVFLADHLYGNKAPLPCGPNGNTDGSVDGRVNMADVNVLIDLLFRTMAPPAGCD